MLSTSFLVRLSVAEINWYNISVAHAQPLTHFVLLEEIVFSILSFKLLLITSLDILEVCKKIQGFGVHGQNTYISLCILSMLQPLTHLSTCCSSSHRDRWPSAMQIVIFKVRLIGYVQ
jgi:hypothetical protein